MVFVPYDGRIFVAPEAITHYIAVHRYRPPDEFIRAVIMCPAMGSEQYIQALFDNGGRPLVALMMHGPG